MSRHGVAVQAEAFEVDVLRSSGTTPVVVCFMAPWSAPAMEVASTLETIAEQAGDRLCLVCIDIDQSDRLCEQLSVRAIPDVRAFDDGVVVAHFVGLRSPAQIRHALEPVLRSPATLHALQGLHAFAAGGVAEAEHEYRLALSADAEHPLALLGLARLLEEAGDIRQALTIYARVPPAAPQYTVASARLAHLQGAGEPLATAGSAAC